jgi:hypothetical protein
MSLSNYLFIFTLTDRPSLARGRTLRAPWRLVHCKLDLCASEAKANPLFLISRNLRPRILPRPGLTRVESSIQSP